MNKLSTAKRVQFLNMLVEGMSVQAAGRISDVSINTVAKLTVEAGQACVAYHDETVRDFEVRKVRCNEI